ncbi:MAG: flippase-like domain-containing protein [Bacteroidales bacterium]|nr:flippase-like domain-containing protein [Bacteroidales bacterium]MBN2762431.1 flippase-like domain-containing protein [Bacteroidales bacterium]
MKKKIFNVIKYIFFLAIGVFLFWWLYKDQPVKEYARAFKDLNYFWIAASIVFGMLSQVSRAIRWNMLIRPLGYKPKFYNSFLSVYILYLINLIIPRAGEIFRCSVMSRYEKIPFAKLVGTVFIERMADFITLITLAFFIILSQLGVFIGFFNTHPEMKDRLFSILSWKYLFIVAGAIVLIYFIFFFFRKYIRHRKREGSSLAAKLRALKYNFIEGIKSIGKLENKWLFIGHTLAIFVMWLFMLYVVFLAYKPTSHLTIETGMITFLMGGLAMLAPVQGGIGAWHFMVIETLVIYGIARPEGKVFALIAHASTNLIYLVFGSIAMVLMPLLNSGRKGQGTRNEGQEEGKQ